ncbi:uncharacterized protein%2C YkwD family [uncultured Clostridium sp.]|uniref:CAP domain-containing protein n=1 Tax=uncultured Clostridium sp. TaxID=59620 RepID=UPI000820804B|nr:CAP domain-containing protein [uncultured Clostridium sp.]SCJ96876.1 uncharacterized protein%2C YkwD family [uncultured Clostridium sp.]
MKNKVIAAIIAIFVIGGVGTTVFLDQKSKNLNESSENKVIKEKSVEDNSLKDNSKVQTDAVEKDLKTVNESDIQIASLGDSEPVQNSIEENEVINSAVDNANKEVAQEVVQEKNNGMESSQHNTATQTSTYDSGFMAEVESMIFNKVNEERSKNGLAPLSYNSTMEYYARIKSQDMGDRGYFDHNNPEGELITAQMQRNGVSYSSWGENIAYIGGVSDASTLANQFMTNWMNSSGHRANILSSNFTSIGIGVYKVGNTVYATQEFYR